MEEQTPQRAAARPESLAEQLLALRPEIERTLARSCAPSLAEDLTDQALSQAYAALGNYRDTGRPLSAWFHRIAHNVLVDYMRSAHHQRNRALGPSEWRIHDPSHGGFDQIVDREILIVLIKRLTKEQKQAIYLRFFEGYSIKEAAVIMKRTSDAVKQLSARALRNMREEASLRGWTNS